MDNELPERIYVQPTRPSNMLCDFTAYKTRDERYEELEYVHAGIVREQLAERDARIAELEAELEIMRATWYAERRVYLADMERIAELEKAVADKEHVIHRLLAR